MSEEEPQATIRDPRQEARLYHEEASYEDQAADITAAHEDMVRSAMVMLDMQDQGPLRDYVVDARKEAARAMYDLVRADPSDVAEIARLQQQAMRFAHICEWIRKTLDTGEVAERFLNGSDYQEGDDSE